jgi:hypothetical protein
MKRLLLVALVTSCHAPPATSDGGSAAPAAPAASSACAAIGQSCMFAPGKLGTCVEVEPTSGPATLVCQSQH